MYQCIGYSAADAKAALTPFSFKRRDLHPDDVAIEITHCGVCHSDLHPAPNEWHKTVYPCVPGHEIVGRVVGVGPEIQGRR